MIFIFTSAAQTLSSSPVPEVKAAVVVLSVAL
jgi:hypothetical protein